jgi:hypothetical protein
MNIDRDFAKKKNDVFVYFDNRCKEILDDLINEYGRSQYKVITQNLQPAIKETCGHLVKTILQTAASKKWPKEDILTAILMANHATNAKMLEYRHRIWPYEYMSFSRRVGELWESFLSICFDYPIADDIFLEIPPVFAEIRERLKAEVITYISTLNITERQKIELLNYYSKVWLLVDAGEIKLELDMHVNKNNIHYNIDFKSGFGSNEKGNTNRLLVVGSIYKNIIETNYENYILVRTPENDNNHYLQTLKKSDVWEVFCSDQAYAIIGELVGFDLKKWIKNNINWERDIAKEVYDELKSSDLTKYLQW